MRIKNQSRIPVMIALMFLATGVWAQSYPVRLVRIVVGFTPGGSMDVVARLLADRLKTPLGQQVIVENRPGAGASIASELVAKAAPDGHTLMLAGGGTLSIRPKLELNLPYSPERDFAPVIHVANLPLLLVVPTALPVRSVKELITLARTSPGKLNYPSSGIGSTTQLSAELFNMLAKVNTTHVPYKGSSQMIADLIGGQVAFAFDQVTTTGVHVAAGKLRALGISTSKRSRLMPEIPTVAEAGVRGYESLSWNGIVVPSATPRTVIVILQQEIDRLLKGPELVEKLAAAGAEPVGGTPEQFAAYIKAEAMKWGELIDRLGIKPQ